MMWIALGLGAVVLGGPVVWHLRWKRNFRRQREADRAEFSRKTGTLMDLDERRDDDLGL